MLAHVWGSPMELSREIAIDRFDLNRKLGEVHDYLAELRHRELAIRFMADRNEEHKWDQTFTHMIYGDQVIHVEVGTHFPIHLGPLYVPAERDPGDDRKDIRYLGDRAREWAESEMTYLTQVVKEVMTYPLTEYETLNGHLDNIFATLETRVEDDFGYLEGQLGYWQGPAADEFRAHFYNKFGSVKVNQMKLVRSLQGALEVSRRTVEYAQQSVVNAVTGARDALRESLEISAGPDAGVTKAVLLAVAGSFTVYGALVGTPLWAAALAGGGFAAGVAAAELPAEGTAERSIGGTSAQAHFDSLLDAIRETTGYLGRELDLLHDELRQLRKEVDAQEEAHLMYLKRPAMADGGVGGEVFYHVSSEQYP